MRRDSGPAIAAATAIAAVRNPKTLVLALAADHIILDTEAFGATCLAGRAAAEAGSIVTFGIMPTEPETSYGYILPGPGIGAGQVRKVERFIEKPDSSTAARYVRDGYLWNSGNFLFRADVLLSEVARLEPDMAAAIEASVANGEAQGRQTR
jgi:mannose-1-phosphate guanylyltransferase / mannose-6-phosphate isomerase